MALVGGACLHAAEWVDFGAQYFGGLGEVAVREMGSSQCGGRVRGEHRRWAGAAAGQSRAYTCTVRRESHHGGNTHQGVVATTTGELQESRPSPRRQLRDVDLC